MSTATMTAPRTAGGQERSHTATHGPRLLLPPMTDPVGAAPTPPQDHLPRTTSVITAPVERGWPTTAPAQPPAELPDPGRLCSAVVLAAVEALRSTRPLSQLVRWVTPEVFEALVGAVRPPGAGPLRQRPVIRSARVCRVSPRVCEGAVVVHDGGRVRAAALRMEVRRGNWRVTALQIG